MIAAGGTADHVHVYASLPATLSLAHAANALKSNSSRWIHGNVAKNVGFRWQEGYGAFTVSKSNEQRVVRYVENQEEHHRTKTFQEEYVQLLKRGMVKYDERYLW